MDSRIKFYFSRLKKYQNKLIYVLFFEIFYTIKFRDFYYKIHNDNTITDALPCPYYFLYEISKFIKKSPISNIIDLGSGNGRVVNFLAQITNKNVVGYEIDQELIDYSISKKNNNNANFFRKDFKDLDFNKVDADCYIFNSPLKKKSDIKNFIYKASLVKKKYFLIVINIDGHLDTNTINSFFENFKLTKLIKAGETKTLRIYENNC